MTRSIDIEFHHAEIVREILLRHAPAGSRVFVFGSRATGKAQRTSDLDLAIDAGRRMSWAEEGRLTDEFDEALVPWSVDVIDLQSITPEFRAVIDKDLVPFLTVDQPAAA